MSKQPFFHHRLIATIFGLDWDEPETSKGKSNLPILTIQIRKYSKRKLIIEIAKNGKGIMPPHKDNCYLLKYTKKEGMTVNQGFEAIYAYLSGCSDGKIPSGKLDNPL